MANMNYKIYGIFEDQECAQMVPVDNYHNSADFSQQPSPYSSVHYETHAVSHIDCWSFSGSPSSVEDFGRILDDGQSVPNYEQQHQTYTFDGQLVKPEPTTLRGCLNTSPSHCQYDYQQMQADAVMEEARVKVDQAIRIAKEIAKSDVSAACRTLQISPDPLNWTVQNTRAWLYWTCEQYSQYGLSACNLDSSFFEMDGLTLSMLTEADFKSTKFGECLLWALDIWKSANEPLKMEQPMSEFDQYLQQQVSSPASQDSYGSQGSLMHGLGHNYVSSPSSRHQSFGGSDFMTTMSIGSPASIPDSGIEGSYSAVSEDNDYDNLGESHTGVSTGSHTPLWKFLREMLANPRFQSAIRWTDQAEGIFKIDDSALVAKKWGQRKHRPAMNYDKLSRSIRQYYKKGIMKKTARSQRLVYQFCSQYAN